MGSAQKTAEREFLRNFQPGEVKLMQRRARTLKFRSGDVLLVEGEDGNSMLLLESGKVRVMKGTQQLALLARGASVGEMALLDPAPRSASVVAASDGQAFELSRETFQVMLDEQHPVAIKALQVLCATVCARLSSVNRMVEDAVSEPEATRGKVFHNLWKRITGQEQD
ncbi:MAG TPA: hypothetical protein DIU15_06245 [Deltaproteobacteria bacterium]|nr:hypothetical protein [Deltaproteobacteria bacterium]HCP45620.1 hypothetical protein [Deltaproteobacteria bacterium]